MSFFSITIQTKPVTIKISDSTIESSKSEKFLGATIGSNFSFDNHIIDLCRHTSQRIHTLSGVANYMAFDKNEYF